MNLTAYLKEIFKPKSIARVINHFKQERKYKTKRIKLGFDVAIKDSDFGFDVFLGSNSLVYRSFIGNNSYCNENTKIINCKIGKFCSIGSNVNIGIGAHPVEFISTHPAFYSANKGFRVFADRDYYNEYGMIEIGNDVWIGSNVTIMNNLKIGDGAVIAFGSVVTKDVEPYSIVGGVPAKKIRYRFDEQNMVLILKSEWWNYSDDYLRKNFLSFHSLNKFKDLLNAK